MATDPQGRHGTSNTCAFNADTLLYKDSPARTTDSFPTANGASDTDSNHNSGTDLDIRYLPEPRETSENGYAPLKYHSDTTLVNQSGEARERASDYTHSLSSPRNLEEDPLEGEPYKISPPLIQELPDTLHTEVDPNTSFSAIGDIRGSPDVADIVVELSPSLSRTAPTEKLTQSRKTHRTLLSPALLEASFRRFANDKTDPRHKALDEQLASRKTLQRPKVDSKPSTAKIIHARVMLKNRLGTKSGGEDCVSLESESTETNPILDKEDLLQSPLVCAEIDLVLKCMHEVCKKMSTFHDYIVEQEQLNIPLYQWSRYTRYSQLRCVTSELERAVKPLQAMSSKLKENPLPRKYADSYLKRARQFSISTSGIATFALRAMNMKTATCVDEVEESSLSSSLKDAAKKEITTKLGETLKQSTAATNSIYSAMDLLQKVLYSDVLDQEVKTDRIVGCQSWNTWIVASLALLGLALASTSYHGHCSPINWFSGREITNRDLPSGHVVVDMVALQANLGETVNAIQKINVLDGLVTSARLKHLEDVHKDTGTRIDNIWDALGPPNSSGSYDFGIHTCKFKEDLTQGIQEIREDVNSQLDKVSREIAQLGKVHEDIIQLRKHIHRVDLRLMKRIDHLKK